MRYGEFSKVRKLATAAEENSLVFSRAPRAVGRAALLRNRVRTFTPTARKLHRFVKGCFHLAKLVNLLWASVDVSAHYAYFEARYAMSSHNNIRFRIAVCDLLLTNALLWSVLQGRYLGALRLLLLPPKISVSAPM